MCIISWYQEIEFLISRIRLLDIKKCWINSKNGASYRLSSTLKVRVELFFQELLSFAQNLFFLAFFSFILPYIKMNLGTCFSFRCYELVRRESQFETTLSSYYPLFKIPFPQEGVAELVWLRLSSVSFCRVSGFYSKAAAKYWLQFLICWDWWGLMHFLRFFSIVGGILVILKTCFHVLLSISTSKLNIMVEVLVCVLWLLNTYISFYLLRAFILSIFEI